jgi:hypothetical protein
MTVGVLNQEGVEWAATAVMSCSYAKLAGGVNDGFSTVILSANDHTDMYSLHKVRVSYWNGNT